MPSDRPSGFLRLVEADHDVALVREAVRRNREVGGAPPLNMRPERSRASSRGRDRRNHPATSEHAVCAPPGREAVLRRQPGAPSRLIGLARSSRSPDPASGRFFGSARVTSCVRCPHSILKHLSGPSLLYASIEMGAPSALVRLGTARRRRLRRSVVAAVSSWVFPLSIAFLIGRFLLHSIGGCRAHVGHSELVALYLALGRARPCGRVCLFNIGRKCGPNGNFAHAGRSS